jgi:hypothetical protein
MERINDDLEQHFCFYDPHRKQWKVENWKMSIAQVDSSGSGSFFEGRYTRMRRAGGFAFVERASRKSWKARDKWLALSVEALGPCWRRAGCCTR